MKLRVEPGPSIDIAVVKCLLGQIKLAEGIVIVCLGLLKIGSYKGVLFK